MCHNSRGLGIQIDGFTRIILQVVELTKSFITKVCCKKRQDESHKRTFIILSALPNKGTEPPFGLPAWDERTDGKTDLNSWRCYQSIGLHPRIFRKPFD